MQSSLFRQVHGHRHHNCLINGPNIRNQYNRCFSQQFGSKIQQNRRTNSSQVRKRKLVVNAESEPKQSVTLPKTPEQEIQLILWVVAAILIITDLGMRVAIGVEQYYWNQQQKLQALAQTGSKSKQITSQDSTPQGSRHWIVCVHQLDYQPLALPGSVLHTCLDWRGLPITLACIVWGTAVWYKDQFRQSVQKMQQLSHLSDVDEYSEAVDIQVRQLIRREQGKTKERMRLSMREKETKIKKIQEQISQLQDVAELLAKEMQDISIDTTNCMKAVNILKGTLVKQMEMYPVLVNKIEEISATQDAPQHVTASVDQTTD